MLAMASKMVKMLIMIVLFVGDGDGDSVGEDGVDECWW